MIWESLLSLKRFGDTNKRLRIEQDNLRLGFEVDYDRIVFSNPFRSLQDKTQVIPFSKTDFVHTRLTHSLEVSVVGRSLGRMAGHAILQKHPHLKQSLGYQSNDFGAITAAASLAHDIGNPPFGHSGEKAIGHFFSSGQGVKYKNKLTGKEYQDLCDFEGNANGFKILTESHPGTQGGLRLSYATLGAFVKYPKASLPVKPTPHVADKKYGYFQSQKIFFKEVADELSLIDGEKIFRHPLTYLVEAADDICYTIIDFEDGINLGWISEEFALEYLINLVKDQIDSKKYAQLAYKPQRLSYLRALAINSLIKDAVDTFIDNEQNILLGTFSQSLLEQSRFKPQIEDIIKISVENVYQSKEVIQKEVMGHRAITTLLEYYCEAAVRSFNNKANVHDKLILSLVPEGISMAGKTLYETLLNSSCFVASLSDGKALRMAKDIGG
ncbi:MAG: dGTPase [Flavobacteriaceae bacterium TMED68]|nr:MAG: dGTPase [Flavobacteriaceae bacterium TMED68]|tara:strand:+ start:278 stop:1597 length:1320 start_codon:yes stop_codon:yes gene_type:complete